MTESTNVWDFLQTAVTIAVPAAVTLVTYRMTRKGQDPKLDQIHTAVNGNLDAEKRKVADLTAQVDQLKRAADGRV